MKTNKTRKVLIAILAVISIFTFAASAFAQTETESAKENAAPADTSEKSAAPSETSEKPAAPAEKPGKKDGKHRPGRPMKYDADRFEDWFENRIDARKHDVDFSQLPEKPTDEEMLDFFRKNFLGEAPERKSNAKPERPGKKDRKADRFEDWFEDRIDDRGHHVDFSRLGEDPTDEEIVEFFRNNFLGNGSSRGTDGKPSGGHKDSPHHPHQPKPERAPKSETAPAEQPTEEVKDRA